MGPVLPPVHNLVYESLKVEMELSSKEKEDRKRNFGPDEKISAGWIKKSASHSLPTYELHFVFVVAY